MAAETILSLKEVYEQAGFRPASDCVLRDRCQAAPLAAILIPPDASLSQPSRMSRSRDRRLRAALHLRGVFLIAGRQLCNQFQKVPSLFTRLAFLGPELPAPNRGSQHSEKDELNDQSWYQRGHRASANRQLFARRSYVGGKDARQHDSRE